MLIVPKCQDKDVIAGIQNFYYSFIYFTSLAHPTFRWLFEKLGLKGDSEFAFQKLQETFQLNSNFSQSVGTMVLIIYHFILQDKDKTQEWLEKLMTLNPDFAFVQHLAGYFYREIGLIDKAQELFERNVEIAAEFPPMQNIEYWEVGWCYYFRNQFEEVIPIYEEFLVNHLYSDTMLAWCGYQLGVCYIITKQPEKAKEIFQKTVKWARDPYSWDQYCKRKASEYLQNGYFSEAEIWLVKIYNSIKIKNLEKVQQMLDACTPQNADEEAWKTYCQGKFYLLQQNKEQAINCFQNIIDNQKKISREKFVIASAYYRLLQIELGKENPDLQKAQNTLDQFKSLGNYDFDKHLFRRVLVLEQKMKKMMSK